MKRMFLGVLFTALGMMFTGCGDTSPSNTRAVTAFRFTSPAAEGTISETSHTVAVTVPSGTDVSALVPTITHTGASIDPATGVARDFTNPAVYTVTAADTSTQDYTVTVTVAPSTAKALTAFRFASYDVAGTISETSHAVAVTVPSGTDVSALVPTITHTGASIDPATGVARDFTNPVWRYGDRGGHLDAGLHGDRNGGAEHRQSPYRVPVCKLRRGGNHFGDVAYGCRDGAVRHGCLGACPDDHPHGSEHRSRDGSSAGLHESGCVYGDRGGHLDAGLHGDRNGGALDRLRRCAYLCGR